MTTAESLRSALRKRIDPVDNFIQKHASFDIPFTPPPAAGGWKSQLATGLLYGAGVAATALAVNAATDAYDSAKNAIGRARGFKSMVESNPSLAREDKKKIQNIYNTLHRFNPEMAEDPFVAGAWVKRVGEYDYVDTKTIADLASARAAMGRGHGPVIDPFMLAKGMGDVAMRERESAEQSKFMQWRIGEETRLKRESELSKTVLENDLKSRSQMQQQLQAQGFQTQRDKEQQAIRERMDELGHKRQMQRDAESFYMRGVQQGKKGQLPVEPTYPEQVKEWQRRGLSVGK